MPLHRKNESGELDVFEAARYFSGANETNSRPENRPRPGNKPVSRLSLDMPIHIALDTKKSKENNKKPHKQPSSPGGKLITALINSIFNQSSKKKKKSKSSPGENRKADQSPGDISRKRRSSMSHFTSSNHDTKTTADSYAKTPTKSSYNRSLFRKFPVSGPGNRELPGSAGHDEKSRFGNRNFGLSERNNNPKATIWDDDEDDDGESHSSSDLFDLPIIRNELDFYSRGLPVYGTTHMERIRVVV